MLSFRLHSSALVFLVTTAGACAAGVSTTGTFGTGGSGGGGGAGGNGGASSSAQSSTGSDVGGGFTVGTGGSGGSAPLNFSAYAHTGKTLYKLDPNNVAAAPALVGDFDCIDKSGLNGKETSMLDLAVSQSGEIWGISYKNVYRLLVQGSSVQCSETIALNNPSQIKFYGLTFAPAGVLDPQKEILVAGNTAGELWAIDTTVGPNLGKLTPHGTFGNVPMTDGQGHDYPSDPQTTGTGSSQSTVGKPWQLSGDIVFLANDGVPLGFATVRDCTSTKCSKIDTLVQIDMTKFKMVGSQSVTSSVRGQILNKGCAGAATAYQQLLGIAAWNDKVYGFSHTGAIVEIDSADGSACRVVDTPSLYWNGAGVTTIAPYKPPT